MALQVVIIGGGVVGLCAAHYCRQRGFDVTVIERHASQRDGCSFGNAGLVVPSHIVPLAAPGMVSLGLKWMWNPESPFHIRPRLSLDLLRWGYRFWQSCTPDHVRRAAPLLRDLHHASRLGYEQLAVDLGGDFGFRPGGLVMLCRTQHGLDEEARTADLARSLGIQAKVLDQSATSALDPQVRMTVCGSVYYPDDCRLDPARLMDVLQATLIERGCNIQFDTEVTDLVARDGRIRAARTRRGEIAGDEFVLAGGCWSRGLAQTLGLHLPLEPGRGYSLTLPQPRQMPRHSAILVEARLAVTPLDTSLRFAGTMELAGMNPPINPARIQGMLKAIPQFYPEFQREDFARIEGWNGLRPCTPDGLPFLGRTQVADNLVVATGHAMMGVSLAPITGQLVAQFIAREAPELNLDPLSPDRYR